MSKNFDLIVIGTGSAASTVAYRCHSAGWQVAVIDSRPFGGTCALRGCDPKKVLVGAAEAIDRNRRMKGKGIDGAARIDWPELMKFKRSFTDLFPETESVVSSRPASLRFMAALGSQVPPPSELGMTSSRQDTWWLQRARVPRP